MNMINFFRGILLCAILTFSQLVFAADYKLVVYETANPTSQTTFAFTPESPGNSNYIATVEMSGNILDYSCCLMVNNVMSSNVYDLSTYLSSCTTGVFSVKTDINNTSGQLYNFNCIDISSSTVYGMACWDAPIVGEGKCIVGSAAAAANNIFSVSSPNVFTYDFVVDTPTAGFKILFSNSSTSWDWANELGKGGSILNIGYGMRPQGGNGDLYLNLSGLQSGEKVRLTLEKTGLNYTLSASFVDDPKLSYRGDDCSTIKFLVDNYDSSLAYDAKLDGSSVTIAPDGTYTVLSPIRGHEYTFSVSVSKNGLKSNEVEEKYTLPLEVAVPHITASSGCDVPVKFTIDAADYNSSLTYSWRINGSSSLVTGSGDSYTYPSPVEGSVYKASVVVTDGCTSKESAEVSQTYLVKPIAPMVSANAVSCDDNIVFTIDNYNSALTYNWTLNTGSGVASGENYIVSNPQDRTDYSVSVTAEMGGCISEPATATRQYLKTPENPILTVNHSCGNPIEFKLDNNAAYPSTYSQTWTINGAVVTPVSGSYTLFNVEDGITYALTLNISNTRNGVTCVNGASISQNAMLKPQAPIVSNYIDCQVVGTGRWEDLITKTDPSYTLKWYDSETSASAIVPPVTYNKNQEGTITYWVSQVTVNNCESDRVKVQVRVDKIPIAFAGDDITICEGTSAILAEGLTEETGMTYSWAPSSALLANNRYSVGTRNLSIDTEFTLTVSNSANPSCSAQDNVWVKVLKKPVVTLDNTLFTVCKGEGITISNITANQSKESYEWTSTPATNVIPYPNLPTIDTNPLDADVTLILKASLNELPTCYSDASAKVTVKSPPVVDAGPDKYICDGSSTRIGSTAIAGVSYKWDNETKLDNANIAMPTILSVTEDTYFTVEAWLNSLPSCKSTDDVWVYMVPLPAIYDVSGDGKYCDGTTVTNMNVTLSSSDADTEYLLLRNGTPVVVDDWKVGENGILTWENNVAGIYTVRARKIANPTCKIDMNGSATIESISSPSANIFIKNGTLACPGDKITLRIDITGGVAPYSITLLNNGVEEHKYTSDPYIEFEYTPLKPTKFEIVSVKDAVCERNYNPADYPTLDLNIPDFDDFQIHSSNNDKPVCFNTEVTLSVDYNEPGATYLWSNGKTSQSITLNASTDETFTLTVTTPTGCLVTSTYNLDVIELQNMRIDGLNQYEIDADGNKVYYYCSNHADVPLTGIPTGGDFSTEPAGLMNGSVLSPSSVLETQMYTIKYEYIDTESGCKQDISEIVFVSAINKAVDWTVAPAFDPPWTQTDFTYCQPHADNPKQSVPLQGFPPLLVGTWELIGTTSLGGGTAPSGAYISPITGVATSESQLYGIVAGNKYEIKYSVKDEFGCIGSSIKTITVTNKEQSYLPSMGIVIKPGDKLCNNLTEAIISSNNPIGNFTLSGADNAMKVSEVPNSGNLVIDPSKGSLGEHKVIHRYQDNQGCPFSESKIFEIKAPIRINSFNIPQEYCVYDDPQPIVITSVVSTDGHIKITNSAGDIKLDLTLIGTPPYFDPSWGPDTYTITYYYNDGTCEAEYSEQVIVHPSPVVDFQLKSDYCLGEVITIRPNYEGGAYSSDAPNNALLNNVFDTNKSGLGTFNLFYSVGNEFGCEIDATTSFQVRGVDPMSLDVNDYYCEPAGIFTIEGFPKASQPQDIVKFSSDRFTGITDNGDGTGSIDLSKAVYTSTYPITYHYIQEYADASGTLQTCETTITENFRVLNEGSDFSGYVHNEVICGDVVRLELKANHLNNTKFTFSNIADYPDAFVDNGNGTAYLYPEKLPEGYFTVTMEHEYYDELGNLICKTNKAKSFHISQIDEINDISLFCDPVENKIAVKLEHSEVGIRYDLMVNGGVYDTQTSTVDGEELSFKAITERQVSVQVVAVDPASAAGCTRQMSKEFNLEQLSAYVTDTDITCYGKTDGNFHSTVIGGIYPYSHTLTDVSTSVELVADSSSYSLSAGQYEYAVIDNVGCKQTVTFEITEPKELKASIVQSDVDCLGASTANLRAVVEGGTGTAPYTYKWTDIVNGTEISTESTVENVPAGQYEVLILDKNGCAKTYGTTVYAPSKELSVKLVNKVDVLITGQATGKIDIIVEGGTPDLAGLYSYKWVGNSIITDSANPNYNETNEDLTNLKAGTYKVIVTDSKSCKAELTVVITEPTPYLVKPTIKNVSCNGGTDGYIYLDISGAEYPNCTYTWTYPDGSIVNTKDITSLVAGTYKVRIEDIKGNVFEDQYVIDEPEQLQAITKITSNLELNCYGDNNANIDIEIRGGTPTYTVDWVGLSASQIVDDTHSKDLVAGTYTIEIKDANNCSISHEVTVTQPTETFGLLNETIVQNKCHDESNGSITIDLNGGTTPYKFVWTGEGVNTTSQNQVNLKAGFDYTVKATDANGCIWENTYTMVNPDVLELKLDSENLTCNKSADGSITANVTGGVAPYKYTWQDPSLNVIPTIGNVVSSLEAGIYKVEVEDNLGCTTSAVANITEPDELTATINQRDITCNTQVDGRLEVIPSGGTPDYSYTWYKMPDTTTPYSTVAILEHLEAATYQVKVKDSNNCSWTSNLVTIVEPTPIEIIYNVQDVAIYGEATGIIDLTITGGMPGVAGYKIEWLRGPSIVTDSADPNYNKELEDITNLLAGDYYVGVTDENGCMEFATIEVKQPEVIDVEVSIDNVKCNGANNGRIIITKIEGGDGNYSYSWTGVNTGFTSSDKNITGLVADIYKLVVTDGAGATYSKEYEITEPDAISITTIPELSTLSVACFGEKTGKIVVDITGGTQPYNYQWHGTTTPVSNVDNITDASAGTYRIMLEDANGCKHTTYVQEIKGPALPLEITENITNSKCYGDGNASIELVISGGTAPYTHQWTGGSGLVPDAKDQYTLYNGETYTINVLDALGCSKQKVYVLEDRKEILVSTSVVPVKCNGEKNGELHASVSGGSGNLSPRWESEDGSHVFTGLDDINLPAGKYIFTVKDDETGCVITKKETITQPDELLVDLIGSSVLCSGIDDGELYASVTGGTQPYNYTWIKDNNSASPIGYGSHLTNLGQGSYEVKIEDKNLCIANDVTGIVSSTPMTITITNQVNIAVHGGNTGAVEISVTGGTPPLSYSWVGPGIDANKSTDQNQDNLIAGTYTVTVVDDVDCKMTAQIEITQPETITVLSTKKDIKCFGDKGTVSLRVEGGYQPYSFEWTGPNGFTLTGIGPDYSEITGLEPGKYDVKITDNAGTGVSINRTYEITEKTQLTWTLHESKTELDCYNDNDGYISIEVSGGTRPYSISWFGPNLNEQGVYSVGNLSVGQYTALITDANNCDVDVQFIKEITQPTELKLEANLTHNTCPSDKSGAIDITVSGGTPNYTYLWSGYDVVPTAEDQENLSKGDYTLHIEDANKCTIDEVYKINANNEISAIINGPSNICSGEEFDIQIDVNGLAPWTIEYTDGTNIFTETTNVDKNVYTHTLLSDAEFKLISVVDANGCEAVLGGSVQVDVHELPAITIVSAQEDCCLGEPALIDIIFAGKGPWTIHYTDGALDYVDGPFNVGRDYLKITPTQIGTKTYTIKSVSNDNCSVDVNYSVDITAYTYPNLEVNVAPYVCEPNPLKVSLHATGEAPWHVVYYLNDLKFEHEMTEADEVLDIYPNKPDNVFLFESIKSGKRCVSKLDKQIHSQMGLLPKDATAIIGQNMVCRNSVVTFETTPIDYAERYEWLLPEGFNIVSGMGSTRIDVEVENTAVGGEVKVWGENDCGEGIPTSINVQVDKPIATGGEITMPAYVCDDNSIFALSVSEIENATNYEWILPTGYNLLSGQGTRSIMVQIDKYALSGQVSVIPSNVCTEAEPVKATILIRPLPFAEAGVDFITACSSEAVLAAVKNENAVSTEWRLVRGNAEFVNPEDYKTTVKDLMYGENLLSWNVDDGYCVGYDTVKVTNQNPGITEPEFSELTICEDYMTLRAGKPEFGMGRWTLIAGDGEIENPNSHETMITGLSNKRTNVIRWEVYSPQCSNSVNVEVISHNLSNLTDAGEDGISTTGSFRLSARIINDAQITGTWTVEAGAGTIEDPHNPNTVVEGLAAGINTLRWTLTGYECEAYDEIKIRMVDEPIASFNIENAEGCEPLTVQFTNTTIGDAEYKWEFGDGSSSDLRSPIHIFEKAGTYTVKLTASANGRVDTYKGEVNVLPSPVAAFSVAERQLYVPNAEAHLYNETPEAVQYLWQFGDGGSSEKENPVYTYLEDGLYDVTYIVSDINLCSDTLVMEDYIKVGKDSYLVFPTAFTPNVEHSNGGHFSEGERRLDVFYPIGRNVDSYKLEIYSSWGNKVFESNDQYIGWDGYYLGKCAAQGTYFYRAEGRFKDGNAFQYSGNLMLIR